MPSPFPGMDPYLESRWGDVHTSLTTYARDQLQPRLPPDLRARIEEYVHLEIEDTEDSPRFSPDVRVVELASATFAGTAVAETTTVVAAEPIVVPFTMEWTERWIQIFDKAGDRLVTTIEFLSPGNKLTPAQRQEFQDKQRQLLDGGANLVEIDLVQEGGWAMSVPEIQVPDSHAYPYRIVVVRARRPTRAECYKAPLNERLPNIRVPLRPQDRDVVLELQPLVDAAWERGRYSDIDYLNAPLPQFRPKDEVWIHERIAQWSQAQTPS